YFWGGLSVLGSTNFDSGMYVTVSGPSNGDSLFISPNSGETVQTSGSVGNLSVLASKNYPGLDTQYLGNADLTNVLSQLPVSQASGIQSGGGGNPIVSLTGLGKDANLLPSSVKDYRDILVWQDRNNSTVTYSPTSNTVWCGGADGTTNPG